MSGPCRVLVAAALVLAIHHDSVFAQSASNVAIVVNDASQESQTIAAHYARVRGIPDGNIFRVRTTTADTIDRGDYVQQIERPLGLAIGRAGLQDRLLYIVLTKGVPLRIAGSGGLAGAGASVDSELTLLYRRLAGTPVAVNGMVENPYFLGTRELADARPFTHRDHDIYLVTRLDGFSVEDVIALIDRAQAARANGKVVLDQRGASSDAAVGDQWLARAQDRLAAQGLGDRVVLESTSKAAAPAADVIGLFTWSAADPERRARKTGMAFVPGAIAANLASFDARTFRLPPPDWQPAASIDRTTWFEGSADALIGDLVREGITGVAGQVGEAYTRGALRPDVLFPAYLSGFNLAESFYLAMPALSWQAVVVGDPLVAPVSGRRLTAADLDERSDPATGLPASFSQRRVAAIAASNRDVPIAAIAPMVRALALIERDDNTAAAAALADAVGAAPANTGWLTTLGSLQERAGDYAAAVTTYERALQVRPDNMVALNNMAYALAVHLNKPAEAKPVAERAVALAPRSATILDTLAWVEHLLGNDQRASQLLADALRFEPRQPEIRLHAAIVFAAQGLWPQADRELAEALKLDPSLESREQVRQLRGRKVSKD